MSLIFGGATTHRVDCGSAAGIDDLDPYTAMAWIYPTTLTSARRIWAKGLPPGTQTRHLEFAVSGTSGDVLVLMDRATSDLNYTTNDTPLVTNEWNFVAVVFNSAAAAGELINIYKGSLTALAVERTYGTASDGSGTFNSDAADSLVIGNNSNANVSFQGRIAVFGLVNAALTLGQIQDWQFRPRVVANMKVYMHLGYNGTGTQPDWSGNANAGTVTGATVGDHVPLGPFFGFDREWQGWFTSAGVVYNRSLTDSLGMSDVFSRQSTGLRVFTDNLGMQDAVSRQSDAVRALSDNFGIADSSLRISDALRALSETMGIQDAYQRVSDANRDLDENLGISDAYQRISDANRDLDENLGIQDAYARISDGLRTLGENLGVSDAYQRVSDASRDFDDSLGISDAYQRISDANRDLDENLGISDAYQRISDALRNFTDNLGITDFFQQTSGGFFTLVLTEMLGIANAFSRQSDANRLLSDQLGVNDQFSRSLIWGRVFLDSLGVSDASLRQVLCLRMFSDSLGMTDSFLRQSDANRDLVENVGIQNALQRISNANRAFVDTLGVLEALTITSVLVVDIAFLATISVVALFSGTISTDS